MTVVLVHPEIPQNTGTIARLCAVTGIRLKLVNPLGFKIDDKHLKRAGLDYWKYVDIEDIASLKDFLELRKESKNRFFYLSKHGSRSYVDVEFDESNWFVFGSESSGLNLKLLQPQQDSVLRIPMKAGRRCLNLANAVSVVVYEALRQTGFKGLI